MKQAIITLLSVSIMTPFVGFAQTANATTSATQTTVTVTESSSTTGGTLPAPLPSANSQNPSVPTLVELIKPSDSELSKANITLLAKNNELQGRIDELTTEINVLVNERSGQLFLYGAVSTFTSFIAGFALALFVNNKRR